MKLETVKLVELKEQSNPRSDFSKVDEIAASIEAVGLLQPIVVKKNGEGFVIVDGAQRLRALKKLGQKETQVSVVDEKDAAEAQLAANLTRADLNVLERARGYEMIIRLYPAKYNAAVISKKFGVKKSDVEIMVSVAKRIPAKFDAEIGACLGQIDFADIKVIAQVPDELKVKLAEWCVKNGGHVSWALRQIANELDFGGDAVNTGALVAAGKAFIVKFNHRDEVYTTDPKVYKTAKEAYKKKMKERNRAAEYGDVQKKTEKERIADRKARIKDRAGKLEAQKALAPAFLVFFKDLASSEDIDALGREICEKHLDSDGCRRLWRAFSVAGCDKVSSYELRGKTWDKVFAPIVKTGQQCARLRTFLSLGWKEGKTPEQAWVAGMKKK